MNVTRHAANMAAKVRDIVMKTMICVMKSVCGMAADTSPEHVHEEVTQFSEVLKKMETTQYALMSEKWLGGMVYVHSYIHTYNMCMHAVHLCILAIYVACACYILHMLVCICVCVA